MLIFCSSTPLGPICCTPRRYVGVITQLGRSEYPTAMPLAANGFRGLLCWVPPAGRAERCFPCPLTLLATSSCQKTASYPLCPTQDCPGTHTSTFNTGLRWASNVSSRSLEGCQGGGRLKVHDGATSYKGQLWLYSSHSGPVSLCKLFTWAH